MADPLYEIEVHLVGDSWIVLEAGRQIASHRQQRDALDHVERILGTARVDVDEAGELLEGDDQLSGDPMAAHAGRRLSSSRRPSRPRTT